MAPCWVLSIRPNVRNTLVGRKGGREGGRLIYFIYPKLRDICPNFVMEKRGGGWRYRYQITTKIVNLVCFGKFSPSQFEDIRVNYLVLGLNSFKLHFQ